METLTTLECLVGAAISTSANTLGKGYGASYTSSFVFGDKYSFEAHCLNDKYIVISLCEVKGKKSNVLIAHTLTINNNELLAPIYANFLWVDFQSLVKANEDLSHIKLENFVINLLNCREDELNDRANEVVSNVMQTAVEYERRDDLYFDTVKYGAVYFNLDCLEYYSGALSLLDDDLLKRVAKDVDVGFHSALKATKILSGLDYDSLKQSYLHNKAKLLDLVTDIDSLDKLSMIVKANAELEKAFGKKTKEYAEGLRKPEPSNTPEDYEACVKYFTDNPVDTDSWGSVYLAEELFDWQIKNQVGFDFQTLACLFSKFAYYNSSADELLRDQLTCEVINIAYVKPSLQIR